MLARTQRQWLAPLDDRGVLEAYVVGRAPGQRVACRRRARAQQLAKPFFVKGLGNIEKKKKLEIAAQAHELFLPLIAAKSAAQKLRRAVCSGAPAPALDWPETGAPANLPKEIIFRLRLILTARAGRHSPQPSAC